MRGLKIIVSVEVRIVNPTHLHILALCNSFGQEDHRPLSPSTAVDGLRQCSGN